MNIRIRNPVISLTICLLAVSMGLAGCSSDSKEGYKPPRAVELSRSPQSDISLSKLFAGHDVRISAGKLTGIQGAPGRDVLFAENSFELTAGADTFYGGRAIVWLQRPEAISEMKLDGTKVSVWCYISGPVFAQKGKSTSMPGLNWRQLENDAMVVWFTVSGDIFVTAKNPRQGVALAGELYSQAFSSISTFDNAFAQAFESVTPDKIEQASKTPVLPIQTQAKPLQLKPKAPQPAKQKGPAVESITGGAFGFIKQIIGTQQTPAPSRESHPSMRYPINLAPAGAIEPNIEMGFAKGRQVATVIGRFYLWQKIDEQGGLLEMLADSAVIFYSTEKKNPDDKTNALSNLGTAGAIEAIYLRGDVVITEGLRNIKADEMYYDFINRKGLAVNATLRTFDTDRSIPIYIRAARIQQLAQNKFEANDVVVTTSEFATPQLSLQASQIIVTDDTSANELAGAAPDSSFDAQMRDIRLKADDTTLFYWPVLRSNLQRPDVPFKTVRIGHDSIWGTTVETKWYLARLLGLQEPEGTSENFDLDYYSKRGLGVGGDVDYQQENRLGKIIGYYIDDHGEDRLGRVDFRRNLKPPDDQRGRFDWVHREFMPYNWQLTTGINFETDEHFVESYYRREFTTGPDRETYMHLKRIEDNWGLAFLAKGRLNNFEDELDEAPTAEYHLIGQSLFDDKFTLYSDTYGGRFRQRIGEDHDTQINEEYFTNGSHRTELDLPLRYKGVKMVPFISGTAGYDDRSGFNRSLVDGSNSGAFNEKTVGIGEAGLRSSTEFWNVYPDIKSRLLDLDGIRHTIRPELATSAFAESDDTVRQHDVFHLNISQRLQTKRGTSDNGLQKTSEPRTVDWMRLDLAGTWFTDNDPRTNENGPARFIWNQPQTPLRMFSMPGILNGDFLNNSQQAGLKKFETYGPYRDYFNADYSWQISDTTSLLSDAYYDIHEGTFEQVDIGFARMRWPDLTYYIGSRYLRDVQVLKEHGSNAFVFAASYNLDERYTVVFAQQYDFDYGANVESDITLIRRYGRMFCSFTASSDASLDRKAIVFNIWPDGLPEMALGSRRYTGLTGSGGPGGY